MFNILTLKISNYKYYYLPTDGEPVIVGLVVGFMIPVLGVQGHV
jgi:hypothetical protein